MSTHFKVLKSLVSLVQFKREAHNVKWGQLIWKNPQLPAKIGIRIAAVRGIRLPSR
jgi:hypothetical protein